MEYKILCNVLRRGRTFKNIIQDLTAGDFLRGLIFALFLLAGLLVCGCVGAPPAEETAEEAGEEVPEGEIGVPAEEEVVEEEPAPEPSGPVDYSGMEYAELIANLG